MSSVISSDSHHDRGGTDHGEGVRDLHPARPPSSCGRPSRIPTSAAKYNFGARVTKRLDGRIALRR